MKVAYIQFEPALANWEETRNRLESHLPEAETADLVVLPELANSGYLFEDAQQAKDTSETLDGPFCTMLAQWCARTNTTCAAGFNERDGSLIYNSSVLISPGGVEGVYRKIHLFNREKLFFQPGNLGVPVFEIKGARLAMLVCFDWIFPEVWRLAALKGADIVCHPSNLVLPGLAQRGVPAHSLMNRIFCITANRIGREGPNEYTGRSIITDARGNVIKEGPAAKAEAGMAEIDIKEARDKQITERNHLLADRRPKEYRMLSGISDQ